MELPGDVVVWKIGITTKERATDRMMSVLRSWFTAYRFVPYTELRLDREVLNPVKTEWFMHQALQDFSWEPDKDVEGKTEMFTDLDENKLLVFMKNLQEPVVSATPPDTLHKIGYLLCP